MNTQRDYNVSDWHLAKHFNKMETNLPNKNNYEIKVTHTNSKYCRFCIRHEIPKLMQYNYLPGKVGPTRKNKHPLLLRLCAVCTQLYN